MKFYPKSKSAYFLPFKFFAGSETCFFSFLFWSFSLCSFLCCSKPAAFFSLLDKNSSTLAGNRSITHSKTLSFCPQPKGVYSIPMLLPYFLYHCLNVYCPPSKLSWSSYHTKVGFGQSFTTSPLVVVDMDLPQTKPYMIRFSNLYLKTF